MSVALYKQLYTFILDEIKNGHLKSGDRVPSEKELAAQFGVSRITSKKALETLVQLNVITRAPGKGSFVTENLSTISDINLLATENPVINEQDSRLVGVIMPDFADAYGATLLHAIAQQCATYMCHAVIQVTNGQRDVEERAIHALKQQGVDGLIVFPVHGEYYNVDLLRLILDKFPLVLVDRYLKGIPACAVYSDNVKAAQELTAYLLDRGHKYIAFVSPPVEDTSTIEERVQGFSAAFHQRGLRPDSDYFLTNLYSTLPGSFHPDNIGRDQGIVRDFIRSHPQVTAFVACEYNIARLIAPILASHLAGGTADIELVCFDSPDDPFGTYAFTHIQQDEAAMGKVAVDLLMRQFAGQDVPRRTIVDFRLIAAAPRNSIAPIAGSV